MLTNAVKCYQTKPYCKGMKNH